MRVYFIHGGNNEFYKAYKSNNSMFNLSFIVRKPLSCPGRPADDPNAYHPGLLEKVEGREKYATPDGIEGAPYNPDPEDLMGAKERGRAYPAIKRMI